MPLIDRRPSFAPGVAREVQHRSTGASARSKTLMFSNKNSPEKIQILLSSVSSLAAYLLTGGAGGRHTSYRSTHEHTKGREEEALQDERR